MTIKSSGLIGISDINVELAFNSNTPKTLNDTDVRTLLGKASGLISLSDAYGKTKPVASTTGSIYPAFKKADGAFVLLDTYGWDQSPIDIPLGGAMGSSNVTPLVTYSGARLYIISFFPVDGGLFVESLDYRTNIIFKMNGTTYTVPFYSSDASSGVTYHSYYAKGFTNPFILNQWNPVEFFN